MTELIAPAYLVTPEGKRYSQFVHGMHTAVVDFETDSEKFATDNPQKIREDHTALAESNSVGSKVILSSNMHKPVLDLDMNAMLLPSTTPKHHHLYIDAEMTWHEYSLLLNVLGHVGILQAGYVRASHARGESFVRLPWIRK